MTLAIILTLATAATAQEEAERYPRPWIGLHFCLLESSDADEMKELITDALVPLGFNTLIVDLSYSGFKLTCDPKVAADPRWEKLGLTADQCRDIADLCRANGIRVVPYFNNMGHQNAAGGPDGHNALLTQYPEFLLGGPGGSPSWNSMMPEIYPIIFDMIDEVIDAFGADAFHVGMDEVYRITAEDDPRTRGKDPAALFAMVVNLLHSHIVGVRGCEMFMWQDTISGWHQGETMRRVADMIPKDIVICNWDYGNRAEYPDVRWYQEKGFRVMTAGWSSPAATRSLIRYSQQNDLGNLVGHLYTNWETSYCRPRHLRAAILDDSDDLPAPSRGVGRAIVETVGLLKPGPVHSIEVLSPSKRGLISADEPLLVWASISERGTYGARYEGAVASLVVHGVAGELVRNAGEVRSSDDGPREFPIPLPAGEYELRLRGSATREGGDREEFDFSGPRVRLVAGDLDEALLLAELGRHDGLLPLIEHPPGEGELLATVGPGELSVSANNAGWLFGPYPPQAPITIGMAFANGTASAPGDHCTASGELSVPPFMGRLQLQLFRADDYSNPEWPGYRFYQVLIDGEVVWEEEVMFEESERWVTVDVTDALRDKDRAELAIRVLDKRGVGQYGTASLVGPARLVGLP